MRGFMRKVVVSRAAIADIKEIASYIRERNVSAADQFTTEVEEIIQRLAIVPGMGHHRSDFPDPNHRCHRIGEYIVIYRHSAKRLDVVRVVHGRRDLRKLFKP